MREKYCGFDDDYIFGIVGGLVMTTYLESPKYSTGGRKNYHTVSDPGF